MVASFLERLKNDEDNQLKKKVYKILASFFVFLGLFIAFVILFPTAAAVIVNTIWVALFAVVVTFLTLGVLVVLGMKKEVGEILDIILEGGLTFLDALEFLRKLWERFKQMLREFLVFASPIFAYIFAFIVYLLVLILYKSVGSKFDVTWLTILLTFSLVMTVGILNRSNRKPSRIQIAWIQTFFARFHRGFTDGLEVVLFIFFLTMDSTNLFFLPKALNNPLHASWGNYDLMVRGFDLTDSGKTTITLIIATITLEIFRNIIRIIAVARKHYKFLREEEKISQEYRSSHERIKISIRKAFTEAKDDLMKFITFNTILLIVFLIFPRLKLMTLVVASVTALILDIFIRGRLTTERGNDLISRILTNLFFREERTS